MPQRQFLIAPALARLIRKEQGVVGRIVEGYFPARPHREHFVSIEPSQCCLVLAPAREGSGAEERAEIPRSHAEALLAVCVGNVGFECTIVPLGASQHTLLQRFIAPGSLDLLTIEFEDRENASAFRSEEHTSELQSRQYLVCRLLLEKKKNKANINTALASPRLTV